MEEVTQFVWLQVINNVDCIGHNRLGTPDARGQSIAGCSVDTFAIYRGISSGKCDNCSNNVCRDDLCRLLIFDVMKRTARVLEGQNQFALHLYL